MKNSTKNLVLCSLFAAMTAVFAQISIPLPFTPVPINFGPMMVLICGAILGSKLGSICMVVYILMGAIGIPVFANLSSGVGIIVGPTGGYILSYILVAFFVGLIIEKFGSSITKGVIAMVIGIIICYFFGTIWFMIITKNNIYASLTMCVIPFIPGDLLKIITAGIFVNKVKPILSKKNV